MAERIQRGWSICSDRGLYVGWRHTRNEMIALHVSEVQPAGEPQLSPFVWGRCLDTQQAKAWQKCRQRGDRAIKVEIRYNIPSSEPTA